MKMTCAVIDDEPLALELMESYVRKTPFLDLKGAWGSATAAYQALQESPVDLIFCDIQMPGLNGMEFSRLIPQQTRIIFTTAFSDYALEGFRVNALDYLLKPISYKDFLEAAGKAQDYFKLKEDASEAAVAGASPKSIFVKTERRLQQISLDKILYIEGMKDYVSIHTEEGDPVLSLMNLKDLEEQLPKNEFFRVHRSYIVRLDKISSIEKGRIVFGSACIPVADSVSEAFYDALGRHAIFG